MNVGELIDILSNHDRDDLVVIGNGWGGGSDVTEVYKAPANFTERGSDSPVSAIIID